jgi:hypothetical protein
MQPITWQDIVHFRDLTGARLGPWEVGIIEVLDDTFMDAGAEEAETDEDTRGADTDQG